MKITHTIHCSTRVSAGLEEDGTLSVKVFGQAEYAKGRTTTAEVTAGEVSEGLRGELAALLEAIRKESLDRLGARIGRALHETAAVAARHGEI